MKNLPTSYKIFTPTRISCASSLKFVVDAIYTEYQMFCNKIQIINTVLFKLVCLEFSFCRKDHSKLSSLVQRTANHHEQVNSDTYTSIYTVGCFTIVVENSKTTQTSKFQH